MERKEMRRDLLYGRERGCQQQINRRSIEMPVNSSMEGVILMILIAPAVVSLMTWPRGGMVSSGESLVESKYIQ